MPIPRWVARVNRSVTNRVLRVVVGWVPGYVTIEHVGRRSGRQYRTPVYAFRRGDTVTVALTYGAESDWLRNVLAAGGCRAQVRREHLMLRGPRVVHDERRAVAPLPARIVLRALGVADFLEMTVAASHDRVPPSP